MKTLLHYFFVIFWVLESLWRKNYLTALSGLMLVQFVAITLNAAGYENLVNIPGDSLSKPFQTSAFWLSTSLGGGNAIDIDKDEDYYGQLFLIDISAHVRYHNAVISTGLQGAIFSEVDTQGILYITFGKSIYQSVWQEIIFSAGLSHNQLSWDDDMSDAYVTNATFLGIPLRFQYLFHLPVGFGAGIAFDMNLNHRAMMIGFSLQAALGIWIF